MILATAGHVDHGKTSLVRALTGVDTDSLAEEKRRGLTIEPGFAALDLGAGEPLAIVDLPGHERFLRNMLAGAAAVDGALMVVAADDGVMPQTIEHAQVLALLGVPLVACVLTKIDRVDEARIAELAVTLPALLAGHVEQPPPLLPVCAEQGVGIEALRARLAAWCAAQPARDQRGGHFRLAVDRVFTRPGAGLVVTGAVLSGRAEVGDELVVAPGGAALRLRAIQRHGREAPAARAGERCALNLTGERAEVERGDWIVAAVAYAATQRLDVELRLLPGAGPLRDSARLQMHLGACTRPVRALLLAGRVLEAGGHGLVQLQLERPVGALRGDRLVLRDSAAQRLIGGARVLDAFAPARGRASPERLADLSALALDDAAAALALLLQAHPEGVDAARFALNWNLLQAPPLDAKVIGSADGPRWVLPGHWAAWRERVDAVLADWHATHPDSLGLDESGLLGPQRSGLAPLRAALRERIAEGAVVREGFALRLAAHRARPAPEDEPLLGRLAELLQAAGMRPPPAGELAGLLGLESGAGSEFLQRAARLGHLVQVAKNRFFLPRTIAALIEIARETAAAAADGRFDAASFRDRSGLGRNLSIQVLEFFDRRALTRYAAERRSWVG